MRSRWNTLTVLAMVGTFGGCNSKSIWQAAYAGDQDTVNSILFWDKFFKTDKVNQIDEARQWTPLHYAINNSYGDMAVLLLDKGADPRIVSGDGRTARQFGEQVSNDLMRNFILSRVDDVLANCEFMASINAEARGTAEAKAQIAQARAKAADVRAQAAERAAADARTEAEEAIARGEDAEAQLGVLQITSDAESTFDTEARSLRVRILRPRPQRKSPRPCRNDGLWTLVAHRVHSPLPKTCGLGSRMMAERL